MSRREFLLPRLGVLAAIVFWGISFVATKAAVGQISPAALIFARSGIGCLVLMGLLALRGQNLSVPKESFAALAAMGFVGVAFHQMLQAYALTLTSAVHAGWLIGVTPIWSAIFAALILHERLGIRKVAGLAVGFTGAVVVITRGRLTGGMLALPSTRGDLLMLASTLNWAFYSVIGHKTIRKLGSARATTAAMGFGWAMLLPFFLYRADWREFAKLSPSGWGAVLFLGVCCSGLGYLFWYAALEKIEASQVAAFLHLEPVVTLVAAVALLGESVTAATILGGVLVVIGVTIVQRSPSSGGSPSSRDRGRRSS
jgi:drug/metabolite transporter (DMT)-like permease